MAWQIYAHFAMALMKRARKLYAKESLAVALDATVFALDSTTIDLCLARFPWTPSQQSKAAVKMHVLLDLRGNIPDFIVISGGKTHDVNILDQLIYIVGAYYVMDRGYVDFTRLYQLHQSKAFFITRAKRHLRFDVAKSNPVDRTTGLICDQLIRLTGAKTRLHFHLALVTLSWCELASWPQSQRRSRNFTVTSSPFIIPCRPFSSHH